MVFNWFQRRKDSAAEAKPTPTSESTAVSPQASPKSDLSETVQADQTDVLSESSSEAESSAAAEEVPVPTTTPEVVEEEDPSLVWAREAYARLKAQQQAAMPAVEQPSPQPTPTPPLTPVPEQASELQVKPEQVKPELESVETDVSTEPEQPISPQPTPTPQLTSAPSTPAPVATGLSLLEQAAAQRLQRQQEQDVHDLETAPTSTPAPRPTAPPKELVDSVEPSLGEFDEDFTWSAEVLAAQGRTADQVSLEEIDWLGRLRRGLEKTRRGFVKGLLENLGDDPLTPEVLEDLETLLLRADSGVQATDQVLEALRQRMNQEVVDPTEGIRFLKEQLQGLLDEPIQRSGVDVLGPERGRLNIWLMVGVNGVGKTTTLGKLANLAVRSGYSALIAAADTFRAAAVQQVEVWGERSDVPVISNPSDNADPAAVVFDAIGAARSRQADLLLVDTAGRLQTKHNLMEELQKVRKIIDRLAPEANVESLLVLDASQGQNGLRQAMAFAQAADLTGVVITKLDGTARGGVALAVSSEAGLPIRFIGAGEGIRDLRPFNSFEFVEALLAGR